MRLRIEPFLRDFGLRQSTELQSPRLIALKKFELPLESVYHFSDDNTAVIGPSQTDPVIAKLKGKVFIEHITALDQMDGSPKRTAILPQTLLLEFRKQNRFFKPLRRDESVKLNTQNVALFNYNTLNPLYRYTASYKATYYRWSNNTATMWEHIADKITRFGKWNHFIELHVPETMPTMAQFKQLERQQTQALMEIFNTGNLMNIFDLYRFLGADRKTSYISKLKKDQFAQMNFFVRVNGSVFVINLGKLDSWRDQTAEEKEQDELLVKTLGQEHYETFVDSDGGYHTYPTTVTLESMSADERLKYGFETYTDEYGMETFFKPEVLQRRFISLMTTLVEYAHGNDSLVEQAPEAGLLGAVTEIDISGPTAGMDEDLEEDDTGDDGPDDGSTEAPLDDGGQDLDATEIAEPLSKVFKQFDLDILKVTYAPPPEMDLDTTTLLVESDELSAAATKTLKVEERRPAQARNEEFTTGDYLLDGVAKRSYRLAKTGMISERTFEQSIDDAMRYETLPDPFGSGLTIKEAMTYSPEDFEVPQDKYPDKTTIMDKAMLSSVHKPMVRKYIKTLLPKDILNSIMYVQRQGVAVTDIKIRENEDVMNHTQTFHVTVKPVRGVSSVLEFTIPVIDKDGRFKSNGVTYRARIQRADGNF